MNLKLKQLLIGCFFGTVLLVGYFNSRPDGLLHVVFCDVGQGDGIYIEFPDGRNGLIDSGPGKKVLTCLGEYMPFWDRTIDFVILTHPHEDHFKGLIEVLRRYQVANIIMPPIGNEDSDSYKSLITLIKEEKAVIKNLYQGERIEIGMYSNRINSDAKIRFLSLWPQKEWVAEKVGIVLTGTVLAVKTAYSNLNDFSEVILMSYGNFDVLFTGDAESDILLDLQRKGLLNNKSIEVVKAPHQGNKRAFTKDLLEFLSPQLVVISVGKNSYGHPAPETLQLLSNQGVFLKRTDTDGEIEVISNGKGWSIK